MVVPDTVRTPVTPSWSRSEDVRQSLNVLDQVLSEFDDNDSDVESFLEDKFIVSSPENDKREQEESKLQLNNNNQIDNVNRKAFKDKEESLIPAPQIDRTKKPRDVPPALPKKVGNNLGHQFLSADTEKTITNNRHSVTNESFGSKASVEKLGSDGSETVKSNTSSQSKDSLGSTSSGTHDYQEINSDLCEAIKESHSKQLQIEKEEEINKQRQAYLQHQHQKRILEENLRNAQKSQGRSLDPKRRSNDTRGTRGSSRGRSTNRSDRRDRSSGRKSNDNINKRSKSSERLLEDRYPRSFQRNEEFDHIQRGFPDGDPRIMDPAFHDPRYTIDQQMIDPVMIDPRLVPDPRLIESHMYDPRLAGPNFDQVDNMGYPYRDQIAFPHLLNYPDHLPGNGFNGPIMPPPEFAGYPVYPYDVPYIPDFSSLTPEEIHYLQSMDSALMNGGPYLEHQRMYPGMQYPMEYMGMGVHPRDYPMFIPYEGIPPSHPVMGDFAPPSPEEAKLTIERMMARNGHPMAPRAVGPSPSQLVKELRRSCRHPQPHRKSPPDTSELSSSNYDEVVDGGRGFRVGEAVGVRGTNGANAPYKENSSAASMPHFSPAKDSGFDESPTQEDSTSLGREGGSARTIGKTKGGMVVSGVLTNVSNMYIPAPPSPVPDYDDEGHSDGCESDILKGSQFYVVDGDNPNLKKKKKSKNKNKKIDEDERKEGTVIKSIDRKLNHKNDSNDENTISDSSPKKEKDTKRLPEKPLLVGITQKQNANPLEAMMDKFHESLPHLNSMEESRFSDDSLEDEDSSTVITSKPSTIDQKNFWNESVDSLYSANDSAASFDYFKPPQKPHPPLKKMNRSNSQSETSYRYPTGIKQEKVKKSISNMNLSRTESTERNVRESSLVRNKDSFSNSNIGNTSTASSDSAKFDTIKNLLKEGLIQGLDEDPPDFVPPPPSSKVLNKENLLREKQPKGSKESTPERSFSSKLSKFSSLDNSEDKVTPSFKNRSRDSSLSPKNKDEADKQKRRSISVPKESPPPLPPPRETSLPSKPQELPKTTTAWLHSSRKSSLKDKLFNSKSSLDKKVSSPSPSRQNSRESDSVEPEMMEVSIYTKTIRDGDKITHIDDFGNEVTFSNGENEEKIYDLTSFSKISVPKLYEEKIMSPESAFMTQVDDSSLSAEPYRKRSESQPVFPDRNRLFKSEQSEETESKKPLKNSSSLFTNSGSVSPSPEADGSRFPRAPSPSKKRQRPPPPPVTQRTSTTNHSRFRSTEDLSSSRPGIGSKKLGISNSTLPSSLDPSVTAESQELKRATSLVISSNKKGQAPPVPMKRTMPPTSSSSVDVSPPSTGYMPSEGSESKSRFNIFRGFWRRNKYSFDKS